MSPPELDSISGELMIHNETVVDQFSLGDEWETLRWNYQVERECFSVEPHLFPRDNHDPWQCCATHDKPRKHTR